MRYLARGCRISGYRCRSTISSEEARMSRWPCVTGALSLGIFVFTGSGQGYNGGPLRNVTDLTPHCASCHSSMSKEDLRVEPEAFATSQLVENKHYKAIEEGIGGDKGMSPADRQKLLADVKLVGPNTPGAPRVASTAQTGPDDPI